MTGWGDVETGDRQAQRPARQTKGWVAWVAVIGVLIAGAVAQPADEGILATLVIVGTIGLWRYSIGALHFLRGLWFQRVTFPRYRRLAAASSAAPSHVYYLITSYRIPTDVTTRVFDAAFAEAVRTGWRSTIVASVADDLERAAINRVYRRQRLPDTVSLQFCADPGTGKREAIARALEQIDCVQTLEEVRARDALVMLVDGDTVIEPGTVEHSAPLFSVLPDVGGLTTNERCEVRAGAPFGAWYRLRFAQRHMNMSSMALGKAVLTLTGRMSMVRAVIATDPEFVRAVRSDSLRHWRLGRFPFLTGDDKSTWMSVVSRGWRTFYVPDVYVTTIEDPPAGGFIAASRSLMFRWYGNSLRQNLRATSLGPRVIGPFAWFVLLDQRVSIWTTLIGPGAMVVSVAAGNTAFALIYLAWIAMTRTLLTVLLRVSGHPISPAFPAMMYYNQVVGSLVKVRALFFLDRQSWTRQQTSLRRDLSPTRALCNAWSSRVCLASAAAVFAAFVSLFSIQT